MAGMPLAEIVAMTFIGAGFLYLGWHTLRREVTMQGVCQVLTGALIIAMLAAFCFL
jgi:hypothetical protein